MRIQGIKAISFDLDGTLCNFKEAMHSALKYSLEELMRFSPENARKLSIDKMIEIRNKVADEFRGKSVNLEKIRLEAFRRTLEEIGQPDDTLASRLTQLYLRHRYEDIELFDDVLPTLEKLRNKYTLGILTNGNSYPTLCGLEGFFRFEVYSQDYCIEKPNPRLFEIALEKSKCSKSQLLHVGDSLETDGRGAINWGIKFIWLNRKKAENNLSLKVDYEITSLLEMLEML